MICSTFLLSLRRYPNILLVIDISIHSFIHSSPLFQVANWVICELEHPQELKKLPWVADYKPPEPPDENSTVKKTPEEIEREIKAQEAELQKLIQVHLKLPSTALWFEPPTIVRWDDDQVIIMFKPVQYVLEVPARQDQCHSAKKLLLQDTRNKLPIADFSYHTPKISYGQWGDSPPPPMITLESPPAHNLSLGGDIKNL